MQEWRNSIAYALELVFLALTHRNVPFVSVLLCHWVNTLSPRQNGRHFADDIFKCIFLNESAPISRKKALKFVPELLINNIPALVQIMAWRRSGDKPLSEPMMVNLPTHICVSRPQWLMDMTLISVISHSSGKQTTTHRKDVVLYRYNTVVLLL